MFTGKLNLRYLCSISIVFIGCTAYGKGLCYTGETQISLSNKQHTASPFRVTTLFIGHPYLPDSETH